jgi:hypothetical protein
MPFFLSPWRAGRTFTAMVDVLVLLHDSPRTLIASGCP